MDREAKISNWKRAQAGLRRLDRPAQRRANWQYLAVYWSLRKRLRLFSFHLVRTRHSLGARAGSSRESVQIVLLILRSIGGSFLFAVLLIVGIAFLDFGLGWFINSTYSVASHWPILAFIYRNLKSLRLDKGTAASLLGTLAQIISVRRGGFGLNPGDMQRSGWKQHFERDMRERGWLTDRWQTSPWERNTSNKHTSPIVRALLRGGDVFSDLSDVFLVEYLLKQPFTIDAPVTTQTESFADTLERELKKNSGSTDDQESPE